MRILQLHTRYRQAGGEDRVVAAEADVLRSAGHTVEQLLADNPRSSMAAAGAMLKSPWNPASRQAVERAVARFKPDIAHVHNTWYALSPSVLGGLRASGVPTVMTVHNYRLMCVNGMLLRDGRPCEDCVGRSPLPGIRHRCYRDSAIASTAAAATIAYNRRRNTWAGGVDRYLAPTEFVRGRLVDGGFPADRIQVKPHFVEDPGPRGAPPSQSQIMLHVGRLSADKGSHALLDAWAALGHTDMELVCIGDGPLLDELSGRRVPAVRFVGSVNPEEVRAWMLRARVLIAPSAWYETFGLVVAEAMAAGLPVIVPSGGALAEVAAGGAALEPENVEIAGSAARGQLTGSLLRARDDGVVDLAGASARARFSAHFTTTAGLTRLVDTYRSVLRAAADADTSLGAGGGHQ
jgi:glycosyltransferase involved in cell wall biosynthesis